MYGGSSYDATVSPACVARTRPRAVPAPPANSRARVPVVSASTGLQAVLPSRASSPPLAAGRGGRRRHAAADGAAGARWPRFRRALREVPLGPKRRRSRVATPAYSAKSVARVAPRRSIVRRDRRSPPTTSVSALGGAAARVGRRARARRAARAVLAGFRAVSLRVARRNAASGVALAHGSICASLDQPPLYRVGRRVRAAARRAHARRRSRTR